MTTLGADHPYRESELLALCERCRKPAIFRCPGCGLTVCADHADFLELCASCAGELHAAQSRTGWVGAGLTVSAGAAFALALAPGAVLSACFLAGGLAAGLLFRSLRKLLTGSRFRRRRPGLVLEGANIAIATDVTEPGGDWRGNRSPGWGNRTEATMTQAGMILRR